jgi:hypothetical protein
MFTEMRPTGVLYDSKSQFAQVPTFTMDLQVKRFFYSLANPPEKRILKPQFGWTRSNEPERHLDLLASKLSEYKPLRILCFSYKDTSLALRVSKISTCNTEIDYIFQPDSTDCFPEDIEETVTIQRIRSFAPATYDLIIIRHYLEHFSSHAEITSQLSKVCKKDGALYIEVPSIELFIDRGCPLFLWEQHVIFFTKKLFREYLVFSGFCVDYLQDIGEDIEPSLCSIVRLAHQNTNNPTPIKDKHLSVNAMGFERYIEVCRKHLLQNSSKRILALGAGHNLDRFMQITKSHTIIIQILDSNHEKHGKYMYNHESPIVSPAQVGINSQDHIILGVHDREIKKTIHHICHQYKCNPTFFSIYQPHETFLQTSKRKGFLFNQ